MIDDICEADREGLYGDGCKFLGAEDRTESQGGTSLADTRRRVIIAAEESELRAEDLVNPHTVGIKRRRIRKVTVELRQACSKA